jgi:TetR/AcrR family transcriptional repressor of nem operon
MKKETTKNALLDIGGQLIAEQGYNHTGIDAVLKAAGVPKGSFYYYFQSKEDFGLQIIEQSAKEYDARLAEIFTDPTRTPIERFRRYFEDGRQQMAQQSCRKGCLIGNLGQELADQSETFRTRLAEIFTRWNHRLAECVREGQAVGEIPADLDPLEIASFCLSGYEGALLKAKVHKNTEPVDIFIRIVFDRLLKNP